MCLALALNLFAPNEVEVHVAAPAEDLGVPKQGFGPPAQKEKYSKTGAGFWYPTSFEQFVVFSTPQLVFLFGFSRKTTSGDFPNRTTPV